MINKKVVIDLEKFIDNHILYAEIIQIDLKNSKILLEFDNDKVILELTNVKKLRKKKYSKIVAKLRDEDRMVSDLKKEKYLSFSLIFVYDDKFDEDNPFDCSWCRGGLASDAIIKLI